jgi:glucose-1-phosphate thymidylyltransferase
MKGVILAGGSGSRLLPLTRVTNKHLLPVGRVPMVYHAVLKLREAGITDILVVTGREHMGDVVGLLGSGADLEVAFTFRVQDEAGGIAQALGMAEAFAAGESLVVILGDNVFEDSLASHVQQFADAGRGARVMLKAVPDAQRFGVASLDGDGRRVVRIVEKPAEPATDLAVTGIYFYDARVFEIIRTLEPSERGELEITDVNNAYIASGEMSFGMIAGWWTDAGTPDSYVRANELAADLILPNGVVR